MKGKITDIDPMSFNSGPGIRFVLTLDDEENISLTPKETIDRIRKFRPYFGPDDGGLTFKGKNLFAEIDYISETCHIAHKAGITTCLMTNGHNYEKNCVQFRDIDFIILEISSIPLYNYDKLDDKTFLAIEQFIMDAITSGEKVFFKPIISEMVTDKDAYLLALENYAHTFSYEIVIVDE